MKETFPEKVNVYFELMSIGLKSVEDKQTYQTGLKKDLSLRLTNGSGIDCSHTR